MNTMSPQQKADLESVMRAFNNPSDHNSHNLSTPETFKSEIFDLCMFYLQNTDTSPEQLIGTLELTKMQIYSYFLMNPALLFDDEDDDEDEVSF